MFAPLDLQPDDVTALLNTHSIGRSLDIRMSSGSTNDEAHRAALQGVSHGHTIVADQQTHGRGTRGRAWTSPPGSDLYFSVVCSDPMPAEALPFLTLGVGLGIARGLQTHVTRQVKIKWPNDIWLDGKKCAGILVESRSAGPKLDYAVIGVGLNVNRDRLDPTLRNIATSMRLATGRRFERAAVLASVLDAMESEIQTLASGNSNGLAERVQQHLVGRGEAARIDGCDGTLVGLAPSGALQMLIDGKHREFRNGTLTFPGDQS